MPAAASSASAAAASRTRNRGTSMGESPSAATASAAPVSCGRSSRSHSAVITAAATSAAILGTGGLRDGGRGERGGELLPLAHDGDGDADDDKTEKARLRPALRVDVDERRAAARKRALDEPVDDRGCGPRRDDDELERARGGRVGGEERRRPPRRPPLRRPRR